LSKYKTIALNFDPNTTEDMIIYETLNRIVTRPKFRAFKIKEILKNYMIENHQELYNEVKNQLLGIDSNQNTNNNHNDVKISENFNVDNNDNHIDLLKSNLLQRENKDLF